jgi:hypothetical protein
MARARGQSRQGPPRRSARLGWPGQARPPPLRHCCCHRHGGYSGGGCGARRGAVGGGPAAPARAPAPRRGSRPPHPALRFPRRSRQAGPAHFPPARPSAGPALGARRAGARVAVARGGRRGAAASRRGSCGAGGSGWRPDGWRPGHVDDAGGGVDGGPGHGGGGVVGCGVGRAGWGRGRRNAAGADMRHVPGDAGAAADARLLPLVLPRVLAGALPC